MITVSICADYMSSVLWDILLCNETCFIYNYIYLSDLNLLDWSSGNQLAVCLSGHVYLWNSGSGDIQQLMELDCAEDYISSVSWVKEGNYLAIGTSTAQVQV